MPSQPHPPTRPRRPGARALLAAAALALALGGAGPAAATAVFSGGGSGGTGSDRAFVAVTLVGLSGDVSGAVLPPVGPLPRDLSVVTVIAEVLEAGGTGGGTASAEATPSTGIVVPMGFGDSLLLAGRMDGSATAPPDALATASVITSGTISIDNLGLGAGPSGLPETWTLTFDLDFGVDLDASTSAAMEMASASANLLVGVRSTDVLAAMVSTDDLIGPVSDGTPASPDLLFDVTVAPFGSALISMGLLMAGTASAQAVSPPEPAPEPATWVLAGTAVLALLRRRRGA